MNINIDWFYGLTDLALDWFKEYGFWVAILTLGIYSVIWMVQLLIKRRKGQIEKWEFKDMELTLGLCMSMAVIAGSWLNMVLAIYSFALNNEYAQMLMDKRADYLFNSDLMMVWYISTSGFMLYALGGIVLGMFAVEFKKYVRKHNSTDA